MSPSKELYSRCAAHHHSNGSSSEAQVAVQKAGAQAASSTNEKLAVVARLTSAQDLMLAPPAHHLQGRPIWASSDAQLVLSLTN